jgi:hypothetical protein
MPSKTITSFTEYLHTTTQEFDKADAFWKDRCGKEILLSKRFPFREASFFLASYQISE